VDSVTSSDGTTIAFDRLGEGPPVILVCGGSTDRMVNAPLAALLARRFTVLNYDRFTSSGSSPRRPGCATSAPTMPNRAIALPSLTRATAG
jgi:hypothetical protein